MGSFWLGAPPARGKGGGGGFLWRKELWGGGGGDLVVIRPDDRVGGRVEFESERVDVIYVDELEERERLRRRGRGRGGRALVRAVDDGLRGVPAERVVQREPVRVERVLEVQAADDDDDLLGSAERPRLLGGVLEPVPFRGVEDVVALPAVPAEVRGTARAVGPTASAAPGQARDDVEDDTGLRRVSGLVRRVEQDDRTGPVEARIRRFHARDADEGEA